MSETSKRKTMHSHEPVAGMKWCNQHNTMEPVENFGRCSAAKYGLTYQCIASVAAITNYRHNNNLYDLAKYRVQSSAKGAARKKVSIDEAYMLRWWFERLQDAKHDLLNCEFCGIRLRVYELGGENSVNKPDALSCDCILPDGGYERGNVAHVCYRCNSKKSNSTIEWFLHVLSRMLKAYTSSTSRYASLLKQAPNNSEALPCNTIKLPLILPASVSTS